MGGCSVPQCDSRSENGVKIRDCPKNLKRRENWVQYLRENGFYWEVPKYIYVCEKHFDSYYSATTTKSSKEDPNVPKGTWFQSREDLEYVDEEYLDDDFEAMEGTNDSNESKEECQCGNNTFLSAMTNRISALEQELKKSRQERNRVMIKLKKVLREKNNFEIRLSKFFGRDQLAVIQGKKNVKWSSKTISKAIFIRGKGESTLDAVRLHIAPLPCLRTLNRYIQDIKFIPGIIQPNVKILAEKCKNLNDQEKYFYIAFDEMAIIPGISLDHSSKIFLGSTTLPSKPDILADQMILFVVMGLHTRIKSNVAVHYTKKGITTGDELREFICGLIVEIENTANIKIQGIAFDLSALDCSLIKSFNIKFNIDNKTFHVQHPNRHEDVLYLSPDGTHNSKNLNQGLKNKDIIISKSLVDEYNLDSKQAKLKDVEKFFKKDQKLNYKLMPKVTEMVLHTKHFSKMDPINASKFHSTDVISTLNTYQSTTLKNNSTSFVLSCFNRYHKIITSNECWSIDEKKIYDDDIQFLLWFADKFLPNITIGKGNMKSVYGARMGIHSLMAVSKKCFESGFKEFKPSRLLTDPVENQFSILRSYRNKPSTVHTLQTLRIMSLCRMQFHPIKGVYNRDENDPTTLEYLPFLKKILESNEIPQNDEIQFSFDVKVPDDVLWNEVFENENEYSAFICHVSLMLNKILSRNACDKCERWTQAHKSHSYDRLQEFRLLRERIKIDNLHYKHIPSVHTIKFILQLEWLFQYLAKQPGNAPGTLFHPSDPNFETQFMENVSNVVESLENLHCLYIGFVIASYFIESRLHIALHSRHLHKAQKFASPAYSNIA